MMVRANTDLCKMFDLLSATSPPDYLHGKIGDEIPGREREGASFKCQRELRDGVSAGYMVRCGSGRV